MEVLKRDLEVQVVRSWVLGKDLLTRKIRPEDRGTGVRLEALG